MSLFKKSKAHKRPHQDQPQQDEEDIICEGSDAEQTPQEIEGKVLRYKQQARRCLDGKLPVLQSASLRGPLERDWINPWRYQYPKLTCTKRGVVERNSGPDTTHAFSQRTDSHLELQSSPVEARSYLTSGVKKKSGVIRALELEDNNDSVNSKLEGCSKSAIPSLPMFELNYTRNNLPSAVTKPTDKLSLKSRSEMSAPKLPTNPRWLKCTYVSKYTKWDSSVTSSPTPVRALEAKQGNWSTGRKPNSLARATRVPTQSILSQRTPNMSMSDQSSPWEHDAQHVATISPPSGNPEAFPEPMELDESEEFSSQDLPMRGILSDTSCEEVQRVMAKRDLNPAASISRKIKQPAFSRPAPLHKSSPNPQCSSVGQPSSRQGDYDDNDVSIANASFITEVAPSSRNLEKFQFRKRKRAKGQVFRDSEIITLNDSITVSRFGSKLSATMVTEDACYKRLKRAEDSTDATPRSLSMSSSVMVNKDIPTTFTPASNDALRSMRKLPAYNMEKTLSTENHSSRIGLSRSSPGASERSPSSAEATQRKLSDITPTISGAAVLPKFDFEGLEETNYVFFDASLGNKVSTPSIVGLESGIIFEQDLSQPPSDSNSCTLTSTTRNLDGARKTHVYSGKVKHTNPVSSLTAITTKDIDLGPPRSSTRERSSQGQNTSTQSLISSEISPCRATPEPKTSSLEKPPVTRHPTVSGTICSRKTLIEGEELRRQQSSTPQVTLGMETSKRSKKVARPALMSRAAEIKAHPHHQGGLDVSDKTPNFFDTTLPTGSSRMPTEDSPVKENGQEHKKFSPTFGVEQRRGLALKKHDDKASPNDGENLLSLSATNEEIARIGDLEGQIDMPNHHNTVISYHVPLTSNSDDEISISKSAECTDTQDKTLSDEADVANIIHAAEERGDLYSSDKAETYNPQSPWDPTDHLDTFDRSKACESTPCAKQPELSETVLASTPEVETVRSPLIPKYGIELLKSLMAATPQHLTESSKLHSSPSTGMAAGISEPEIQKPQLNGGSGKSEEPETGWQPFVHPMTPQYHGIIPFSELMPTTPTTEDISVQDNTVGLQSTQLLMEAATRNPWTSALKNKASTNPKKRVSWMPSDTGVEGGPSPPIRRRNSPPPPEISIEDNVLDGKFDSHFLAARRAKGYLRRITPHDSSSPPIDATAEAFVQIDRETSEDMELRRNCDTNTSHTKSKSRAKPRIFPLAQEDTMRSDSSPRSLPVNTIATRRTINYDMNEFLGENGGILEEWSVEGELKKASRAPGTDGKSSKIATKTGGLKNMKHW